ncbi:DNA adenine methylase [Pseudovibrio ascidiaceicola]|uniref:DNA adenine methylase n=1 Tax=Pseudovibrio ascidiaceicola TaxID=285279 RepID=UPI003D36FE35
MNLFGEVEPVKAEPIAPYLGGKSQLAKTIVGKIQQIKHATFVDVFFGMGGVFFRRVSVPKLEVINDINNELVTLFRVLRSHPEAFLKELEAFPASRVEFDALKNASTAHMTDLQRAVRFFYLQRLSFGGKVDKQVLGFSHGSPYDFTGDRLQGKLKAAASRLDGVVIESMDWRKVLSRYDSADALFYLDPPYWGGEADYGQGVFERKDFAEMAELLSKIKGRFLLSLNDREEVRQTFEDFNLEQVHLNYSIGKEAGKKVAELIISN